MVGSFVELEPIDQTDTDSSLSLGNMAEADTRLADDTKWGEIGAPL